MNNQQSLTPRRRRSTGVGGSPSKQRKLVAVSQVAPPHSLLVPTQMLTQCQHFRLKGSPKSDFIFALRVLGAPRHDPSQEHMRPVLCHGGHSD